MFTMTAFILKHRICLCLTYLVCADI